jgi:hypothetical protein
MSTERMATAAETQVFLERADDLFSLLEGQVILFALGPLTEAQTAPAGFVLAALHGLRRMFADELHRHGEQPPSARKQES